MTEVGMILIFLAILIMILFIPVAIGIGIKILAPDWYIANRNIIWTAIAALDSIVILCIFFLFFGFAI